MSAHIKIGFCFEIRGVGRILKKDFKMNSVSLLCNGSSDSSKIRVQGQHLTGGEGRGWERKAKSIF